MILGLYILGIVAIILTIAGIRQAFAIRARLRGGDITDAVVRRNVEAWREERAAANPELRVLQGGRR